MERDEEMMSVKNMIDRFGVPARIHRKEINVDDMGYKGHDYSYLKTEKLLMKKPLQAWEVVRKSGNLVKRENLTFIASLDSEIQEGDRLYIDLNQFIVLKVSQSKEYTLVSLDRGNE